MTVPCWLPKLQKICWAFFLVAIPVTSFPFFPAVIGGNALVRPLSLYPLAALMVIVTLPRLFIKPLPRTVIPFIIFVIIAIASTALAFTRGIDPSLGVSVESRAVRTLITLALGGMFYLTVALTPSTQDDLRFTLRWLYIGFIIALLWGTLQSIYIIEFNRTYFDFLNEAQKYISIRKLFTKRISGMTFEPSWYAEQIAFLLMPWLFSSILSKFTVFRWHWRWLTIEMLLLGWATLILLFTFSREGLSLLIVQVILFLLLKPRQKGHARERLWRRVGIRILQISLTLMVLGVVVFAVGRKNNYFSRLWGYWSDEESVGTYFYYIAFSQRIAYWETAYRVFEDYPVLGVGLGNYTFYFDEYLPDRQYRTPEIFLKLVPDKGRNQIVTVKNMFLRVLAETGVVGTAAFLAFLIALSGCVFYLLFSTDKEHQYWGRAGLLGLAAFLPMTFSVDSFAIPNMWIVFGLITASAHIFTQTSS